MRESSGKLEISKASQWNNLIICFLKFFKRTDLNEKVFEMNTFGLVVP